MRGTESQYLSFKLGDELFAMEINLVKEVVEWEKLEPAPRSPPILLGVFNYHGKVVSVVDIADFFGEKSVGLGPDTRIVVLAGEDMSVGFRVDRANKIENFDKQALKSGQELAVEKNHIKAVVNHEGRLYNIVDTERLLENIENRFEPPKAGG